MPDDRNRLLTESLEAIIMAKENIGNQQNSQLDEKEQLSISMLENIEKAEKKLNQRKSRSSQSSEEVKSPELDSEVQSIQSEK